MKQKLIILSSAMLFVGICFGTYLGFTQNVELMSNIEALAEIEEGAHGTGRCYNDVHYVENELVLVCGSCIYIQGDKDFASSKGTCE